MHYDYVGFMIRNFESCTDSTTYILQKGRSVVHGGSERIS